MVKVVGWTDFNNVGTKYEEADRRNPEYYDAIIKDIREKGYRFSGDTHQNGYAGAPVFNDGTAATFSLRGWGALMADALEIEDADGMAYCRWAWTGYDEVEPDSIEDSSYEGV